MHEREFLIPADPRVQEMIVERFTGRIVIREQGDIYKEYIITIVAFDWPAPIIYLRDTPFLIPFHYTGFAEYLVIELEIEMQKLLANDEARTREEALLRAMETMAKERWNMNDPLPPDLEDEIEIESITASVDPEKRMLTLRYITAERSILTVTLAPAEDE